MLGPIRRIRLSGTRHRSIRVRLVYSLERLNRLLLLVVMWKVVTWAEILVLKLVRIQVDVRSWRCIWTRLWGMRL
jgi:hypothetical protein